MEVEQQANETDSDCMYSSFNETVRAFKKLAEVEGPVTAKVVKE
jgi:hypothetical protein